MVGKLEKKTTVKVKNEKELERRECFNSLLTYLDVTDVADAKLRQRRRVDEYQTSSCDVVVNETILQTTSTIEI